MGKQYYYDHYYYMVATGKTILGELENIPFEYIFGEEITSLDQILKIASDVQKKFGFVDVPTIIFYSLLRKETRFAVLSEKE